MKKIYIVLGMLSLILSTSCKKYLDQVPTDRLSMEKIFETRESTRQYLASVYTYIPDEYNQRQLQEGEIFKTYGPWTAASDEAEYTWTFVLSHLWNNNTITATEGFIGRRWKSWYTGIHTATKFITYAPSCPELSETTKNQWIAEARALRAIYYFYLVRAYGPVPVIGDVISQDTPLGELQIPRSTSDECFDYIISELRRAVNEGLVEHVSQEGNPSSEGYGRIDRTVARAFIIEAMMFRASPLFNGGNQQYAGLTNPDGTKLFPTLSDADKKARWKAAADEAASFIADYVPRFYDLQREYTNGVLDPYLSYRAATRGAYTKLSSYTELIFYRIGTSSGTMQYDRTPNHKGVNNDYKGGGALGATQEMVDAYFMANGQLPVTGYESDGKTPVINAASGYSETGKISADYKDPVSGRVLAPSNTSRMYYNREPRFYAGITFSGQKWLYDKDGAIYTDMTYSGNAGKLQGVNDFSKTGYVVRKSAPEGPRGTEDRVCILLRLAQVYLNYVEALNESDPSNPDILKYLNLIRERAGIPKYGTGANALPVPAAGQEMAKAIMAERRVELAFENSRFFDVRRWGTAEQNQNKAIYGMNVEADGDNFYKRTKVEDRVFDKRQYFFPIPQSEIDIDKALVQNPGY
ncbi:putative outer membrane starch-binding protein [Arcticibacter tournemirensis]|uniref:RagB/SusD family nutrient uptake outer membrane protein n=1 Tax=Arcticibacter tournemirensis TaxID=699437 RepID=A0A5M9HJ21_9SPHI|nr:RagB/SusD family nutrient uptake outer membrane protein [Arcticibacter tournemirensis]KAA8486690.1 RagB/SusD family nutrient uptake outer membrane protein [Arcticibacter tournemirensis]TQM49227.1 putative outer membrane starch-binding protein [Arcticibacter tournemirensis]